MTDTPVIQPTADVSELAVIGARSRVWHLAQVREGAQIGADCNIGRGAYVGPDVVIGDSCKLQNYALVYEPARLGNGVFIGPGVVLTNDEFPRAANIDGTPKSTDDWHAVGVTIENGASVGARAVCVAPVTIGAWALVAAGAVVTKDVPAYALVVGAPARRVGWVGESGHPLERDDDGNVWICPVTASRYREVSGSLSRLA